MTNFQQEMYEALARSAEGIRKMEGERSPAQALLYAHQAIRALEEFRKAAMRVVIEGEQGRARKKAGLE